jgi:hypothetical protein
MKVSKHITYYEATRSHTAIKRGIKNDPGPEQLANMKDLAAAVFEPLRVHFNEPIRVNSFFRSVMLNDRIGGAKSSQHVKGKAIDISGLNGITNAQLFNYIANHLEFDQLIWEFGTEDEPAWVHVSFTTSRANRRKMLRAVKIAGKTKYLVL